MKTFNEILELFKKKEEDESECIIPLIDSTELRHGISAWKSVRINRIDDITCKADDYLSMWEWMWEQVEFDMNGFATVAGVKVYEASSLISRLKGLRLIYPDGSINKVAQEYLHELAMGKLSRGKGRPKKEEG